MATTGHFSSAWPGTALAPTSSATAGAGTGTQRFAPLNSWPDNVNLEKARRLLWLIKQKYGQTISWACLMISAANCALDSMGLKTFGFAGGRKDVWEPGTEINWGPESEWLGDQRYTGDRDLENPLAAMQMGLIDVNPEGPKSRPDPLASAVDIRETFRRMAMDDTETVALSAGGHAVGKAHGADEPDKYVVAEPEGASIQQQGLGWKNTLGTGSGEDTISSGVEGAWTAAPTQWDNAYLEILCGDEWELTTSPAGAQQWTPTDALAKGTVPDAHNSSKSHAPMMCTTDLALRIDPSYEKIVRHSLEHPDELADAFARAWFKVTHRDMGPILRYLGPLVPAETQLWQDPVAAVDHDLITDDDIGTLKATILASGLCVAQLVAKAWGSAVTFRGSDKRGGANGARMRLAPQRDWEANDPAELAKVLEVFQGIQTNLNAVNTGSGTQVSLADLIVLGGSAAIEQAAKNAGHDVQVPFAPGRTDASEDQTDVESFAMLEPTTDGFRNYAQHNQTVPAEYRLLDRASLLTLSAPEMTVLVGGKRVLNLNSGRSAVGVLTDRPESLTTDFFVNLLHTGTEWTPTTDDETLFDGRDRSTGAHKWTASRVDLVFGSNSQLRAITEVYATDSTAPKFVNDFVAAWVKVMNLDRFDLV